MHPVPSHRSDEKGNLDRSGSEGGVEQETHPCRSCEMRRVLRELPHQTPRGGKGRGLAMNSPRKPSWRSRDREKFNAQWKQWYRTNAQKKIAWQQRRKAELKNWLATLKSTMQCLRCEERTPECLQFHHRDPTQKDLALAQTIPNGWSKERILREIAKCDVLCANCHLKLHWEERQLVTPVARVEKG
jgi:hypothetical protein